MTTIVLFSRMAHLLQPLTTSPSNNVVAKINSVNNVISGYYCHLCGIEYLRKHNLQRHLRNIHLQVSKLISNS